VEAREAAGQRQAVVAAVDQVLQFQQCQVADFVGELAQVRDGVRVGGEGEVGAAHIGLRGFGR
jgi:hypothetical protein